MFCAAIRESDKNRLFCMKRTAVGANEALEELNQRGEES